MSLSKANPHHPLGKHIGIPLGQPDLSVLEVQTLFAFVRTENEGDSGSEFTTNPEFALNRSARGKVNLGGLGARPLLVPVVANCQSFLRKRNSREEKQGSHNCEQSGKTAPPDLSAVACHAAPPTKTSNSPVVSASETTYTSSRSLRTIRRMEVFGVSVGIGLRQTISNVITLAATFLNFARSLISALHCIFGLTRSFHPPTYECEQFVGRTKSQLLA